MKRLHCGLTAFTMSGNSASINELFLGWANSGGEIGRSEQDGDVRMMVLQPHLGQRWIMELVLLKDPCGGFLMSLNIPRGVLG